jgi:calcium-dependent protein kinase
MGCSSSKKSHRSTSKTQQLSIPVHSESLFIRSTKTTGRAIEANSLDRPQTLPIDNRDYAPQDVDSYDQLPKIKPSIFVRRNSHKLSDAYQINKKIGEGQFGYVRLAMHKTTNQERAVKSIEKSKITKSSTNSAKIFLELEILKELDHPNILKVFEFFEDGIYFHMVSEYINGEILYNRILTNKNIPEETASNIMQQILSGIAYCHEKSIIHREIHPENILIQSNQGGDLVKIIGFGASAMTEVNLEPNKEFQKLMYTAPEVLSAQTYSKKSDVWSCGVILYTLLTGKPPFYGKDSSTITKRILNQDITFKGPEWQKVSGQAKELVQSMLQYNPDKRISAQNSLEHPWIAAKNSQNVDMSALANLKDFKGIEKIHQAVLMFIGSQTLSRNQVETLTQSFRKLDLNGDGKISREELLQGYLKTMNRTDAAAEVEFIMEKFDSDNSGFIDYTEFLAACLKQEDIINQKNLDLAFKAFDTDQSGKISIKEIQSLLNLNTKESSILKEKIKKIDKDGDGEINLHEFKEAMIETFT